ncbi:MAG: hypothetical protein Q6363_007350 [Candidatus Njordarchaeota archaeon]
MSSYLILTSILSSSVLISRLIIAGIEAYLTHDIGRFRDAIFNPIRYYDAFLVENFWVGFTGLLIWYLFLFRVSFFIAYNFVVEPFRKDDKFISALISLPLAYILLNFFAYGLPNANYYLGCFLTNHADIVIIMILVFIVFPAILYYNIPMRVAMKVREMQIKNLEYKLRLLKLQQEIEKQKREFKEIQKSEDEKIPDIEQEILKRPAIVFKIDEIKPQGKRIYGGDTEEIIYDPQNDKIYLVDKEQEYIFVFEKDEEKDQ